MPLPSQPMEYADALAWARQRGVLPTTLTSEELLGLPAQIRRMAFFSSQISEAGLLQDMQDLCGELTRGVSDGPGLGVDQATVRLRIKQAVDRIGYQPDAGRQGTISDLRTDARINLIIQTQLRMAQGYGQYQRANSGGARLAFPAQELVRLYQRRVPRGFEEVKGRVVERNPMYWLDRWQAAGGDVYDGGRMIALKDSPVWEGISRFGTPWPPFDFNSGMGVKNVGRRECLRLGLIEPDQQVADPRAQYALDDGMAASGNYDAALLQRLQDSLRSGLGQNFEVNSDGILEAA